MGKTDGKGDNQDMRDPDGGCRSRAEKQREACALIGKKMELMAAHELSAEECRSIQEERVHFDMSSEKKEPESKKENGIQTLN